MFYRITLASDHLPDFSGLFGSGGLVPFLDDAITMTGVIFLELWPLVALAIGLILGVWVIAAIIRIVVPGAKINMTTPSDRLDRESGEFTRTSFFEDVGLEDPEEE